LQITNEFGLVSHDHIVKSAPLNTPSMQMTMVTHTDAILNPDWRSGTHESPVNGANRRDLTLAVASGEGSEKVPEEGLEPTLL